MHVYIIALRCFKNKKNKKPYISKKTNSCLFSYPFSELFKHTAHWKKEFCSRIEKHSQNTYVARSTTAHRLCVNPHRKEITFRARQL